MIKEIIILLCFALLIEIVQGQNNSANKDTFTIDKKLPVTSVKNQYKSSTCWTFSVLSMLETEFLQKGKDTFDLSEMFIVRQAYSDKAKVYVRMHGVIKFSGGGALNDPINVIAKYGILPEEVYNGLEIGEKNHEHHEMDEVLKGYVDNIIKNENGKLSPVWHDGFVKILDTYLGKVPKTFEYKGKTYTPKSFAQNLDINPEDYILLTSFTHHPFYEQFILEVPDNWSWGKAYNLPIDELISIIDYSINNNYSVAWATDISETGYKNREGLAEVDEIDSGQIVTQEMRQVAFDNYETQDDHGMHIYGLAHNKSGEKYYVVKNSWGINNSVYDGHLYASKQYIRYKTLSILVNKNGIPKSILEKLNLEK